MCAKKVCAFMCVVAFAMGCTRDINSPTTLPPAEPQVGESGANADHTSTNKDSVVLPKPEWVEGTQDGQIVQTGKGELYHPENNPHHPENNPQSDPWDISLPPVEFKTGQIAYEQSPRVEKQRQNLIQSYKSEISAEYASRRQERVSGYQTRKDKHSSATSASKKAAPGSGSSPKPMPNNKPMPNKSKVYRTLDGFGGGSDSLSVSAFQMPGASAGAATVMGGSSAALNMPAVEMHTNEFSQFDSNRFLSTATHPLSTFGADVDTASYGVFRRSINEGRTVENLGLRAEEMINYFKYDYPEPKSGEPFSVTTEISSCPWNKDTKLLLVGAKTRGLKEEERPASNIVFLFDISGSMSDIDRLQLLKVSVISMLPKLTAQDKISIVTYSGQERFIIDGVPGDHHATIMKALSLFNAGGVTNGEAGIKMAYAVAKKNFIPGGNNRIIMGTDGDLNVGVSSTNELRALVEKKREDGIFLTILGVGMGNYKDNRLEALADYGNGSYHYVDSLREGTRVLSEEFMSTVFVVAKDVKFQVDFNPGKIKGYRQIGYETRRLNAEDFADDTKDGGEVGAGHQVTILYEIVEQGSKVNISELRSKYQKTETINSDEYATVKLRYKKPDGDVSSELRWPVTSSSVSKTMSDNLILASSVAEVAMILNHSAFKGTASIAGVLKRLQALTVKDEYREEWIQLVKILDKRLNKE